MFDAREAFTALQGRTYDTQTLRTAMQELRVAHLRDLPAEYQTRDLYELAAENNWLQKIETGKYEIKLPPKD